MTDRIKDTITNKTTISIGILVLLAPIFWWAATVQAETHQNAAAIEEQKQVNTEVLDQMRDLQNTLNITNNNLTEVRTRLDTLLEK